jgi:hypothetical protein
VKPAALRAARAGAQLLAGEQAKSAEAVVERLLAVQTQDLGAGMLSLRARAGGLTIPDVEEAINGKAIVTTWVNRGTIHMLKPDDLPWLLALTAPPPPPGGRRRDCPSSAWRRAASPSLPLSLRSSPSCSLSAAQWGSEADPIAPHLLPPDAMDRTAIMSTRPAKSLAAALATAGSGRASLLRLGLLLRRP